MISADMLLESYDFNLPSDLIATHPSTPKESAKLLVYKKDSDKIIHSTFKHLFDFIPSDYLIVLNNTRVIKARLFCKNLESTKMREIFYHKAINNEINLVQIKGKVRKNDIFKIDSNNFLEVVNLRNDGFREVIFFENLESKKILSQSEIFILLEKYGKMPLPPYIKREATPQDSKDYQSLFALHNGSIAAPTASLHFSSEMLAFLESNFKHVYLTLHVGAGTFKPVESSSILKHKMHSEYCQIESSVAQKILNAQNILCIGSTAMRSVEWLLSLDSIKGFEKICGKNDIFLHPLNKPKKVNALLTNFHLPKSSLIMLVSSLISRENTLKIYQEAIAKRYKFYSYGDCMLII